MLWLWHRPVATAPVGPPSLGTSVCRGSGSRKGKKKKRKPMVFWWWKLVLVLKVKKETKILLGEKLRIL